MKDELYINGKQMDLAKSEPIGFSYQVYDIAQLEPQAAYSNRFFIPETNNNDVALNASNIVASNTLAPYRKLPCTFIRNGTQIINNGVAIIEGSTGGYDITIYSSIFDFFQQLGELSLKDIDWSDLNHLYNLSTIRTINEFYFGGSPLSNVSWPIINWGAYSRTEDIDIKYQMPNIRYSYIMDKIFAMTDYTMSGNIFRETVYEQMALTLSPDQYSATEAQLLARSFESSLFQNTYSIAGYHRDILINLLGIYNVTNEYDDYDSTEGAFYVDSVNPVKTTGFYAPPYSNININGRPAFIDGRGDLIPAVPPLNKSSYKSSWFETVLITAHIWCKSRNETDIDTGAQNRAKYVILKNDEIIVKTEIESGTIHLFENEYSIDLIPGDEVKIYIEGQDFYTYKEHLSESSYITIEAQNALLLNSVLNFNSLVPELKLKDIVRSFCQQFFLIITPDDTLRNISFTAFREIKGNIANAEDWSDKLDLTQKPSITYRIASYAQRNNLKYLQDDATKGYGDGYFTINDTVLPVTVDLSEQIYPSALAYNNIRQSNYQPPSGNTGITIPRFTLVEADDWAGYIEYVEGDLVNYGGIIYECIVDNQDDPPDVSPLKWEVIPLQYEQTESSPSRLVLIRPLDIAGASPADQITFTDGITTLDSSALLTPVAYFSDPEQINQLNFTWLIQNYGQEFVSMLNKLKVVSALINLTELDILELDFLTLKYISYFDNYFYLTKVEEYQQGQSTQCQLIRM